MKALGKCNFLLDVRMCTVENIIFLQGPEIDHFWNALHAQKMSHSLHVL